MKRELNEPHKGDKRFQRRTAAEQFAESDDMGCSLAVDRRKQAKNMARPGEGDKGDR